MKKILILLLMLSVVLSGCIFENDGDGVATASMTVSLDFNGDTTFDGKTVYYALVAKNTLWDNVDNWLGVGTFTLASDYGSSTATVPDSDGNPTSATAMIADGTVLDIYIFVDDDGNFNPPTVIGPNVGDEAGSYTNFIINASMDNTLNLVEGTGGNIEMAEIVP